MEPSELGLNRINHVCIMVRDLDATMERFWRILGIGPWRIHTSGHGYTGTYHGQPNQFRQLAASAQAGSFRIELVQHLEGDTTGRDFLERHGEGLQHVGIYVSNLDEALAHFKAHGIGVLTANDGLGARGDGRHTYVDTVPILGAELELVQPAFERVVERTYP